MKRNIQSDNEGWPQRLRAYDTVQHRVSSKEDNWNKLRDRLDESRKRKRPDWYWIAAAVIAIIVVLTLTMVPTDRKVAPGATTQQPALIKEEKKPAVATGPFKNNKRVDERTARPTTMPRLQPAPVKYQVMPHLPSIKEDSLNTIAIDTPLLTNDVVQRPGPLPTIHVNDILTREPLPPNISTQRLRVQNMIRLFNIDMTTGQEPKARQKETGTPHTIPNDQN